MLSDSKDQIRIVKSLRRVQRHLSKNCHTGYLRFIRMYEHGE